jgi:opine dehydrogenase
VRTPLARAFLAIGSAVCGMDFLANGRTLANLGLAGVGRAELQALLAEVCK